MKNTQTSTQATMMELRLAQPPAAADGEVLVNFCRVIDCGDVIALQLRNNTDTSRAFKIRLNLPTRVHVSPSASVLAAHSAVFITVQTKILPLTALDEAKLITLPTLQPPPTAAATTTTATPSTGRPAAPKGKKAAAAADNNKKKGKKNKKSSVVDDDNEDDPFATTTNQDQQQQQQQQTIGAKFFAVHFEVVSTAIINEGDRRKARSDVMSFLREFEHLSEKSMMSYPILLRIVDSPPQPLTAGTDNDGNNIKNGNNNNNNRNKKTTTSTSPLKTAPNTRQMTTSALNDQKDSQQSVIAFDFESGNNNSQGRTPRREILKMQNNNNINVTQIPVAFPAGRVSSSDLSLVSAPGSVLRARASTNTNNNNNNNNDDDSAINHHQNALSPNNNSSNAELAPATKTNQFTSQSPTRRGSVFLQQQRNSLQQRNSTNYNNQNPHHLPPLQPVVPARRSASAVVATQVEEGAVVSDGGANYNDEKKDKENAAQQQQQHSLSQTKLHSASPVPKTPATVGPNEENKNNDNNNQTSNKKLKLAGAVHERDEGDHDGFDCKDQFSNNKKKSSSSVSSSSSSSSEPARDMARSKSYNRNKNRTLEGNGDDGENKANSHNNVRGNSLSQDGEEKEEEEEEEEDDKQQQTFSFLRRMADYVLPNAATVAKVALAVAVTSLPFLTGGAVSGA